MVSAADLVDGAVTATPTPPSGSTFPLGTTTVNVTAIDAAGNIAHGSFTVTVLTPLQSWRQLHFSTFENSGAAADTADPNHNGIPNLVEYALGGDPLGATTGTAILPQPALSVAKTLQISFTRYLDRTDLTLVVQAADTVAGPWTDLAQSTAGAAFVALLAEATVAETGTGNTRNVMVTDPYLVTDPAHPCRFLRLQVVSAQAP